MSRSDLQIVTEKLVDYTQANNIGEIALYWQGGEVFTLGPEWVREAAEYMLNYGKSRETTINHYLQTNLLAYGPAWDGVIRDIFGSDIGTSMDFPNKGRIYKGSAAKYEETFLANLLGARENSHSLGAIAVPAKETLDLGAKAFFDYYVNKLGFKSFQINTPFDSNIGANASNSFYLDPERVGDFLIDLFDLWLEFGASNGVRIGPFDWIVSKFLGHSISTPCLWKDNCAYDFICLGPKGEVAQCDCWTATFKDMHFGNILEDGVSLEKIIAASPARKLLLQRPMVLMEKTDCADCDFLAMCHGGCPVRAYGRAGNINDKDPYCLTYKKIFAHVSANLQFLPEELGPPAM